MVRLLSQDIYWAKKYFVSDWISEVEKDIEHGVITENLVSCLREMLDYIRQLEEAYLKLKKRVEELEERLDELEEDDANG